MKTLIKAGADVDLELSHSIDIADSALFLSTSLSYDSARREGTSRILLDAGAPVNRKYENSGFGWRWTPLITESNAGNSGNVKLLVEYGADMNSQGAEYGSALITAMLTSRVDVVSYLFEKGADVNFRTASQNHLHQKFQLLKWYHDAWYGDESGWEFRSPIAAAILAGNVLQFQLLLNYRPHFDPIQALTLAAMWNARQISTINSGFDARWDEYTNFKSLLRVLAGFHPRSVFYYRSSDPILDMDKGIQRMMREMEIPGFWDEIDFPSNPYRFAQYAMPKRHQCPGCEYFYMT